MECGRLLEWDMGHRVYGHESKCAMLHGHRYKADVTCYAGGLDDLGRVVDFGVIKRVVGGWVNETWDHRTMLFEHDPMTELFHHPELSDSLVSVTFNPTAENISAELLDRANYLLLGSGVEVRSIKLWETPNCYAISHK